MDFGDDFGESIPLEQPANKPSGGYNGGGNNSWKNKGNGEWKPKPVRELDYPDIQIAFACNDDIDVSAAPESLRRFIELVKQNNIKLRVNLHAPTTELFTRAGVMMDKFTPWKGFDNKPDDAHDTLVTNETIAYLHHFIPKSREMKPGMKKIMALNLGLVLGRFCNSRAAAVVIWTQDGMAKPESTTKTSGYAYSALEYASRFNIPYYNINNGDSMNVFENWVNRLNLLPQGQTREQYS